MTHIRKETEAVALKSLVIVDSDKRVLVNLHGIEVSISHQEFRQMIGWYMNRHFTPSGPRSV